MNIGFIGYGEVGREMSKGLSEYSVQNIYAFDPLHQSSESRELSEATTLTFFDAASAVLKQSLDILFVAVPAANAVEVWDSIDGEITKGTLYVDMTTASAKEKRDIERRLNDKNVNLIDAAILGALNVYQNSVPILASGKDTHELVGIAKNIGMDISYLSENVGDATNFKFIRSIFTKGLSTLLYEVMEAAEKMGIEEEIFESITETMDKDSFAEILNRYIKSNVQHSRRREQEMENVIDFMKSNGLESYMTNGTKQRLADISESGLGEKLAEDQYDWKRVMEEYNRR